MAPDRLQHVCSKAISQNVGFFCQYQIIGSSWNEFELNETICGEIEIAFMFRYYQCFNAELFIKINGPNSMLSVYKIVETVAVIVLF